MSLPNLASDSLKACYKRELGSSGLTYASLLDSLTCPNIFYSSLAALFRYEITLGPGRAVTHTFVSL